MSSYLFLGAVFVSSVAAIEAGSESPSSMEQFQTLMAKRQQEASQAYNASPYAALVTDLFCRYTLDPEACPGKKETAINPTWKVILPTDAAPLADLMAGHFVDFMARRMQVTLCIEKRPRSEASGGPEKAIVFLDSGGGTPNVPESFTIHVKPGVVCVAGRDPAGLRDGIVRLVDAIGFRQAPILALGSQTYAPRLRVREGAHGSYRDVVFMGYNAVAVGGGSVYELSTSDAIPELAVRRNAGALDAIVARAKKARRYGLKTYISVGANPKFPKDDPVFKAHPDIRGALTWKADGEYTLCTEHPLVKRYLMESVEGIFRADPELDGIEIIIGGESFYHCFMRPYGVKKGHTNCARCEALGAETVVSDLCNALAEAARKVNPNAEIYAWPYSASYVWSADWAQVGLIQRLKPGAAILTEPEKDEVVKKPQGINKSLWDYSIDLTGLGDRARQQIEACKAAGISIRLLSMIEQTFEASLLPHIPCMDRWVERAEALASSGADSVIVFQMGPYDATSAAEINKFLWWDPAPNKEELLQRFAARIAGRSAGPHVRKAWKYVSEAIDYSPEIGDYYKGPHYLGPAHPMCADPNAKIPNIFYGYYLFLMEVTAQDALKPLPVFITSLSQMKAYKQDNAPVLIAYYSNMERFLKLAADEMKKAQLMVPERCRLMFDAENSPVQWFYHTARTEANFCRSCEFRDELLAFVKQSVKPPEAMAKAKREYRQWRNVLLDEKANVVKALPLAENDVRLDFYHRGDHSFFHLIDMLRTKQEMLDHEITEFLPNIAKSMGQKPAK